MKYLRRQNFNTGNILDDTIVQTTDGRVEINPVSGLVQINADLSVSGAIPGPEVTNVMYVTLDGDDNNSGFGEGPNQAKRTIKAAVAAAQEGTTIFVRSGEYYEDNPIRLPPKVSIIGDNLRRTILRPLNGPKKFTATNVSRTDGVVTVTTAQQHELKLHDRVRVIIPEANIDIECANITEILNSNQFSYKDYGDDLVLTSSSTGTVELGVDFFLVTNQSYIAQLVFKGFQAPGYCLNIDKDAIVDTSPYIQNCSNINGPWMRNGVEWLPFQTEQPDLTGAMVKGPRPLRDDEIDPAQVHIYGINERGAGGGMLIDGDRYNPESPIKSMVADAFTQVSQGGIGFHITNFGYMQLVSCFSVFCDKAFYTTNGGYLSISNSVIDFGNKGFVADGYYPIPYSTGVIQNAYYSSVGSITVNSEGTGYTGVPNVTVESPNPAIPGSSTANLLASIDTIRGTVNAVTVIDAGYGYDFQPNVTIDPPFTPYTLWQPNTVYSTGDYVVYEYREYRVASGGTSGPDGPTHTSGTASNGTTSLTLVGAQARATVNLAKNLTVTVNDLSEKPQVASIMFVGNDPIGYYIEGTSNSSFSFKYNEQKCRRDVGYIVNAVLNDLIFGTNFRTIYAGRAYLRSYSSKVLSSQRAQTVNGIDQARVEVKNFIIPSNPALESKVDELFNIVTNIIQTGDVGASVPEFTSLSGRPAGFIEARDILLANKQFFKDQIVDYIANNLQGFQYDESKCSRDVGIIVNAVIDDLVFGTNYQTKTAALSYLRSYTGEVLTNQLVPTIKGIERARDIVLKTLQDEYDSEIKIKELFDIVTNILRNGNATGSPDVSYTDPTGVSSTIISGARAIETNKSVLVDEVVSYINANLDPFTINGYSETLCRRDVGYIIDALVFDIMYGGNSATVKVANSFFDPSGNSVVSNQISEHVSSFTQLKTYIASVAPAVSTTASNLINVIIDAINLGQVTIPSKINPTYTVGSLYQYYSAERQRVSSELTNIQSEVISYLNTEFGANFTYNEAVCRRDIGYIVDALAYDLTYGGNTQTTNAALAYSEGSVIAGEVEETKKAYQYWKSILPYVLQNQAVPNAVVGGQVTNLSLGSPVPQDYPSTIVQNLLQIVIDAIDHGPGYVPEPVTESEFNLGDSNLVTFKSTVLDNLLTIQDNVINFLNSSYGGNIDVTVFPGILDVPPGSLVRFHNVSTISTGGTALEYVGAGVTYNALPFFGGEPIPTNERNEINNGKCFTVTNDQVGNFRVGSLFEVNALTGGVTIDANNLSLKGLESIGPFRRNGIPVGVELKEVSNNPALISSLGTQDVNTVPTQQAVSTYVENRYLNKVQSSTPQTVESDVAFQRDVAIQGGDLTTNQTTFNLLNTTATTVNAFGAGTAITVGANGSGTLTLRNANVVLSGDLEVRGGDITTNQTSFNLLNTTATTVNAFGAATSLVLSSASGTTNVRNNLDVDGDVNIDGGDLTVSTLNFNLVNTTANTVNAFGAATTINMGAATGTATINNASTVLAGNLQVRGNNLTTNQTSFNLINTTATSVSAFGAATLVDIGATTGTTSINNNLDVDLDVNIRGGDLTASTSTFNLLNTGVSTVNAFGAATTIAIGAATGTTNIKNKLDVDGDIEVGGNIIPTTDIAQDLGSPTNRFRDLYISGASIYLGNVVISDSGFLQINSSLDLTGNTLSTEATTFNLINTKATTVNTFGAATTINMGESTGTFNVNSKKTIFNSTNSIQIPAGTTGQRDLSPVAGQIRYNTSNNTFEGFGPGNQWGSLGGVKDVDGNTYIIAELTPGANDNTLWFYNDGVQTLTITKTDFDLKSPVVLTVNNTTNATSSTSAALVVKGGVGVAKDIVGSGVSTSNIDGFTIDEGFF